MSEWRDIDTAPQDGTPFLAAEPPSAFAVSGEWLIEVCEWRDDDWRHSWDAEERMWPTHWMPLPAPPAEQEPTR